MAKTVRFYETGSPEVLKIEDLPLAEPGKGEVRLKVEAIGLNRAEIGFRQGQYLQQPEFPARLGADATGIVEAVGPDLDNISSLDGEPSFFRSQGPNQAKISVGDRVMTIPGFSLSKYGVYGESVVLPASFVTPYPQNLSPVEAAGILVPYLTPWGALVDYGQMQAGDYVVVTAASSSVGVSTLQIIRSAGAIAIATTRSSAKKQALLDAGADHVIVTGEEDLTQRIMEITTGKGARLIFDPVVGSSIESLAAAAAQGGTIFVYGALSMEPAPLPLWQLLGKELNIRGYSVYEVFANPDRFARGLRYLYDGLETGKLKPLIERTFKLDDIVEAHRYMESNQQVGKLVVTV